MKYSVFLLNLLIFVSCSCSHKNIDVIQANNVAAVLTHDTIYVPVVDSSEVLRLQETIKNNASIVSSLMDSIKYYRDSTTTANYMNARKIEKIKYYINITEKKPTNKKFFYGWIKRTMTE
jgi:hypothetical protein